MPTRQQTGRIVPNRARAGVRPVYEDFRPTSEWKQEEQSVVLLVYLPGFTKEQIRVFMEGTSTLQIKGERLVGGNKWSRFEEEFPIPGECNIPGIHAKFEGGTLTVTVPKKSVSQVGHREAAKETQEAPPPPDTTDKPTYGKAQEDIHPTTSAAGNRADDKSVQSLGTRETASSIKHQKDQDSIPPKITSTIIEGKQNDGKVTEEPSTQRSGTEQEPQMGRGEAPLKTTSRIDAEKQADGKGVGSTGASKIVQERVETTERSEGQGRKPTDSKITNTASEKTVQNEGGSRGRGKESIEPETAIKKSIKKENEEGEGTASVQKEKTTYYSDVAEEKQTLMSSGGRGADGDFKLEKYKQAMKRLVVKGNLIEERQLIVNMGTAILVIVALGAYISYTLSSSGKAED